MFYEFTEIAEHRDNKLKETRKLLVNEANIVCFSQGWDGSTWLHLKELGLVKIQEPYSQVTAWFIENLT